jgi:hypothetical protein
MRVRPNVRMSKAIGVNPISTKNSAQNARLRRGESPKAPLAWKTMGEIRYATASKKEINVRRANVK